VDVLNGNLEAVKGAGLAQERAGSWLVSTGTPC
jgi:hypothetical protein